MQTGLQVITDLNAFLSMMHVQQGTLSMATG